MERKPFALIIEGCDLSGKSTLLEALKNKFDYSICVKNMIKPKNDSWEETVKLQDHYNEMLDIPVDHNLFVIYDRYFPSQSCYKFKRDGGKPMEIDNWVMDLDERTAEIPSLLVILDEDIKVLEERFKKRGEDFLKIDELERVKENYKKYASQTHMEVLFTSTLNNLQGSVNDIINKVNEIRNRQI